MKRPLTALFAALEALLVVGVGIGIPLVPLTIMWAFQYGLQIDFAVFWRGAADVWLLGHGVDIEFTLDPLLSASLGVAPGGATIPLTIAPLGFAILTLLFAMRAGRRIGEVPHRHLGHLVAIGTFAVLSLVVTVSAFDPAARPSLVQGAVLPTLVFALGIAIGSEVSRRRLTADGPEIVPTRILDWIDHRQPDLRAVVGIAARGGALAASLVLAASAVTVAVLVAVGYGQIIALYEGVQSGVMGGAAITVAQLAFIPNLVVWGAAWFIGPGFAIGTGSAVGPLGTTLGPIPAVPLLGALPSGDLAYGFVGLLVPVLAGFAAALLVRPRLVRAGLTGRGWLIGTGVGLGVAGGVVLGALAWLASGSAGPGRLVDVGAPWLAVGLWGALEIGLAAAIALLVAGVRSRGDEVAADSRAGSRAEPRAETRAGFRPHALADSTIDDAVPSDAGEPSDAAEPRASAAKPRGLPTVRLPALDLAALDLAARGRTTLAGAELRLRELSRKLPGRRRDGGTADDADHGAARGADDGSARDPDGVIDRAVGGDEDRPSGRATTGTSPDPIDQRGVSTEPIPIVPEHARQNPSER